MRRVCQHLFSLLCCVILGDYGEGCNYNGEVFEIGKDFTSSDGCNRCVCLNEAGMVGCTDYTCPGDGNCRWTNGWKLPNDRTQPFNDGCGTLTRCTNGTLTYDPEECGNGIKCKYFQDNSREFYKGSVKSKGDECNVCDCTRLGETVCSSVNCSLPEYQKCKQGESIYNAGQTIILQNCNICECKNGDISDCITMKCTTLPDITTNEGIQTNGPITEQSTGQTIEHENIITTVGVSNAHVFNPSLILIILAASHQIKFRL